MATNFFGGAFFGGGFFGGDSPANTIPQGGAGHPARIDWQGKRRKATLADQPNEHLRQILDRVVSEYYGDIVAADLPQSVKKEAAAIVKPFAEKQARYKSVPKAAEVDWVALERNAEAVASLIRLWNEELALQNEDDEILMILLN